MKTCKILMGPIAGNGGVIFREGQSLDLDDDTAVKFAGWGYVSLPKATPTVPPVPVVVAVGTATTTKGEATKIEAAKT